MSKTVYARLSKGFPMATHSRAGVTFAPGPDYVPVEIEDDSQLKALEGDPTIEIFDGKGKPRINSKPTPEQEGSTEELQDPANVSGEAVTGDTTTSRASQANDATRFPSPEAGAGYPRVPQKSSEDVSTEEQLKDLTRSELVLMADNLGVEEIPSGKDEIISVLAEKLEANKPETTEVELTPEQAGDTEELQDPANVTGEVLPVSSEANSTEATEREQAQGIPTPDGEAGKNSTDLLDEPKVASKPKR